MQNRVHGKPQRHYEVLYSWVETTDQFTTSTWVVLNSKHRLLPDTVLGREEKPLRLELRLLHSFLVLVQVLSLEAVCPDKSFVSESKSSSDTADDCLSHNKRHSQM